VHASDTQVQKANVIGDIDRLFLLQDATAFGVREAAEDQKSLFQDIAKHLHDDGSGQFRLLIHPVAAYVLSGGNPQSAEDLSQRDGIDPQAKHLLEAVALFMRGDRPQAAKLFRNIDPLDLPARLAGRVALAQALLKNGTERQDRFALAIAAMPGTLVEESALRRSAIAYAEAQDARGFWQRLERYNRRYSSSLYAASFWNEATGAIISWPGKATPLNLGRLDLVLAPLPESVRRSLYLELARRAAAAGKRDVTEFAGRRLARLARDGSNEQLRGQLYTHLFHVVASDGDDVLSTLQSLRRDALQDLDRALLDSALALGRQIEQPAEAAIDGPEMQTDEEDPLVSRGATLLSETRKLLKDGD
jgi:chemotaxis protein MotC